MAACAKGADVGESKGAPSAPRRENTSLLAATGATTASSDPYATAAPSRARSIGHTSYVLKLKMDGGLVAAYKPRSHLPLGDRRYKSEIAAYRLARALGLENVPRAIPRALAGPKVEGLFSTAEEVVQFRRTAAVDADGLLRGALIPWVERYEVLPLEKAPWRARWESWLTREWSFQSEGDRRDAAAISTMVTFDYLTANWDRWSGGNVARDGATGAVLFVDNDGAFYDPPPSEALARQLALLKRVVRFSRGFVSRLRALDEGALPEAIGEESPGVPLLGARAMAAVIERRKVVLALIDARLALDGESRALPFE